MWRRCWRASAWFDEVVTYVKRPGPGECGGREATRRLGAARLDQVLLLTNSFRTAWMAWRSRASVRIGYRGQLRGPLLTKRLEPPKHAATGLSLSTLDAYLRLVSEVGCPPEPPRLELATTPADEAAADAVWKRLGLPAGDDVVVFNTGGAFGSAKNWPAEHFAELSRRIASDWKLSVLVNCGPKERDTARAIVARASDPRVVSLAGEPRTADRAHQGLHPPSAAVGDNRQRTTVFGHRIRAAGGDALRADRPATGGDALRAGDVPVAGARMPAVHEAGVSAGASSLHARFDGRSGFMPPCARAARIERPNTPIARCLAATQGRRLTGHLSAAVRD